MTTCNRTTRAGFNRAIIVGVKATPGLLLVARCAPCTWQDDPMWEVTCDLNDPRITVARYDVERDTMEAAVKRHFNFNGTIKHVSWSDLSKYRITIVDLRE